VPVGHHSLSCFETLLVRHFRVEVEAHQVLGRIHRFQGSAQFLRQATGGSKNSFCHLESIVTNQANLAILSALG
jgi:hypothetical protein